MRLRLYSLHSSQGAVHLLVLDLTKMVLPEQAHHAASSNVATLLTHC